jgi:hypothetical protein
MVIHPITGILRKWLQNKPMNISYPIPWCFTDKSNLWPRWSKWSVQHNEHLLFFNLNLIHLGSHSHWHSTCHDHALDKAAHLKQIGSSSTEIQWWLGNGHAMVKRLLQTASTIKYCNLGILLVPSCTVWYCVYIYNLEVSSECEKLQVLRQSSHGGPSPRLEESNFLLPQMIHNYPSLSITHDQLW